MKIGWSEVSLVPDKPIRLQGQFYERVSKEVETPISATAMAMESNGNKAIIVSVDIVELPYALNKFIRERISQKTDKFKPEEVILAATHSHTSFQVCGSWSATTDILNEFLPDNKKYTSIIEDSDEYMTIEETYDFLAERISKVVIDAWNNREDALYANEFGRAAVGMCRRVVYDDGSAKMWGDTNTANFVSMEGGNDSGIELIYTFDKNKKLKGVVANIACPAQVLEQRSFISSDYWGKAKQILREKLGSDVYLLGLAGAGGDQCPRDLVRWVEPETPILDPNVIRDNPPMRKADPSMFDVNGCRLIGKRIANEIASVYEEIKEYKDTDILIHNIDMLHLPLRRVTISEYNDSVENIIKYVERNKNKEVFNYSDSAAMFVYAGNIERYREQQTKEIVETEVHTIRFGDVAFATNPFELFLDFGNQMKARSLAEQVFVVQLACDCLGYLPTEKAEKGGHYSAYISSGVTGHEGGELLVRETLTRINDMFK